MDSLPAHGFKEWSLVCQALGSGAQSLILRKGGIHEGRGGFWWRHDRFFLFPTHFHEQEQQFHWPPRASGSTAPPQAAAAAARASSVPDGSEEAPSPRHTVEFHAVLEAKYQITCWETVLKLAPLHFWAEDTLRERFDYSGNTGISLAFVRVRRLPAPWVFPDERKYGGCRSWLDLPAPPADAAAGLIPVTSETEHAARRTRLEEILGPPA